MLRCRWQTGEIDTRINKWSKTVCLLRGAEGLRWNKLCLKWRVKVWPSGDGPEGHTSSPNKTVQPHTELHWWYKLCCLLQYVMRVFPFIFYVYITILICVQCTQITLWSGIINSQHSLNRTVSVYNCNHVYIFLCIDMRLDFVFLGCFLMSCSQL